MTDGSGAAAHWVLGVDSGGSGMRLALARAAPDGTEAPGTAGSITLSEPVRTGPGGIEAAHMLGQLVPAARSLLESAGATGIGTACVGAAGMAMLGNELRAELPGALAREFGVRRTALAADAVTAYVGALGERPGAVLAAGTGMIALGTDLRRWWRADGWGHLLGDCGSGAWIGRAGLEAALRAYDGREGGSAALRDRAEAAFGTPLDGLPGQLYPRTDRAAVLASFAPEVARCAESSGDSVAVGILRAAAREIAASAAAVCPGKRATGTVEAGVPEPASEPASHPVPESPLLALSGGLVHLGGALLAPLDEELEARLPGVRRTPAAGDPLHGALLVAARLAYGELLLPGDPELLSIS